MMRTPEKTVGNILDKQSVVYLGTVDADGLPNIKAMLAPRLREGIGTIYLTTNTSSRHAEQLRQNPGACVYFCDRRFFRGVMLRGRAEVLEDASLKELIWRPGDERYYALGPTDPDYCVIKFTARDGRYYSAFKSEDFEIEESV